MQALKELAYLVTKNKIRPIELINNTSNGASKIRSFYEGILDNQFDSDDDAAQFFYDADRNDSKYQKLKSSLKKRLINTLFFIDIKQPSYNDRQKAYYECYREWAAAKILLGKNAWVTCIGLSHKILKIATKYEFTELILDISRTLRMYYGGRVGDLKKFEQYNALHKQYEEIYLKENLAEEWYVELMVQLVNKKSKDTSIKDRAMEYVQRLEEDLEKYDSYNLHFHGYLIQVLIYSSAHEHQKTIEVCKQAIEFFQKKPYTTSKPLQGFFLQELVCYTELKQYQEGKISAEKASEFIDEGSFNWFKYQEQYLKLSLHTNEYQAAYETFNQAINHKRFQFLTSNSAETWKIFEAYIHYLIDIGRIKPHSKDKRFTKFRLGKFLNDTPNYAKDKRAMNVTILIVQILFMILQRKYDMAVDKIEAIEKYCSRYLRKDDAFRSNCFIKMLLLIPSNGFHKAGVERKSKKFLERLQSVPPEESGQMNDIEIIPYENLWDLTLESLEYKYQKQYAKTF